MRKRSPRLALAVALCIASIAAVPSAFADARPSPIAVSQDVRDHTLAEARKQHRAGVEAFAAGQYEEAIAAFLTADALHPSSETAFNIAKAYEAQGDNSHALQYYREYLRRAPSATDRDQVAKRISKLSQKVALRGLQQASFIVSPAGSAVLVDSEPIGSAPVTLDLRPGKHVVEFRKAGYSPAQFEFELPVDRPVDVVAKLAASKVQGRDPSGVVASAPATTFSDASEASAAPGSHVAPSEKKHTSITRTIGFAALGASVAALGGAVTLEIMRGHAEDEAKRETDQVGYSEALERMKSRQTMARVFAGAGGALAALGGVMLVVASGATTGERPKREGLALNCLPGKCHAVYSGAF
jgi:tetratricopeptide (TPR) repeat protein